MCRVYPSHEKPKYIKVCKRAARRGHRSSPLFVACRDIPDYVEGCLESYELVVAVSDPAELNITEPEEAHEDWIARNTYH